MTIAATDMPLDGQSLVLLAKGDPGWSQALLGELTGLGRAWVGEAVSKCRPFTYLQICLGSGREMSREPAQLGLPNKPDVQRNKGRSNWDRLVVEE